MLRQAQTDKTDRTKPTEKTENNDSRLRKWIPGDPGVVDTSRMAAAKHANSHRSHGTATGRKTYKKPKHGVEGVEAEWFS